MGVGAGALKQVKPFSPSHFPSRPSQGNIAVVLPYEPSLARALVAHERAVRRGPDPV